MPATEETKALMATTVGLQGVFGTLAMQHGELSLLLSRAESATEPSERSGLWASIRRELLSHEKAELEAVYPTLQRFARTRALAEAHEAEAGEMERLVSHLTATDVSDPAWPRLLIELAARVRAHAEQEENAFFPAAQEVLTQARAEQLDSAFTRSKKLLEREIQPE